MKVRDCAFSWLKWDEIVWCWTTHSGKRRQDDSEELKLSNRGWKMVSLYKIK